MLVDTEKVLAMRCPECGRLECHRLRRFAIARGGGLEVKCSCGAVKLLISTGDRSNYRIKISCAYCGGHHRLKLSGKRIWSLREVMDLLCFDTGLDIGHIGPEEAVKELISSREKELEVLVDEFGRDEYFYNSAVMYEVLRCLQQIAEKGALHCQCGNRQIGVDIFPDRLELHCGKCESLNIVYAETDEDLQVIQQIDEIELAKNGFVFLDSLVTMGKFKKNPGRGSKN